MLIPEPITVTKGVGKITDENTENLPLKLGMGFNHMDIIGLRMGVAPPNNLKCYLQRMVGWRKESNDHKSPLR